MKKEEIIAGFQQLQDQICRAIEAHDREAKFQEETWQHLEEGGGRTRILQHGRVLEKAGVNFSAVSGQLNEAMQNALQLSDAKFSATGISIVMHPNNPWAPIIHMNVRYFETKDGYWFGGGIDLTPHYVIMEDAQFFHQKVKDICDRFSSTAYVEYSKWADDYFFIPHRNETRGIGGIFFDRLNEVGSNKSKMQIWEFVKDIAGSFAGIYTELLKRREAQEFGEVEKQWQSLRRGRYVEFNLVYDRGTKFGFETSGRTESILMSLPPIAAWEYQFRPEENSAEFNTLQLLKKGQNWLA